MVELSPTTTYLADANLFIRAGAPRREKAQALIEFFSREPWTLLIHPDVEEELTDVNRKYPQHRTLQRALSEGWAKRAPMPDDPIAPVNEVRDAARECIGRETSRRPEAVEDTDVNLVARGVELLEGESIPGVGIITNDQAAGTCFDRVLWELGYRNAEYIDAKILLQTLYEYIEN